jgi:hypothetical protein
MLLKYNEAITHYGSSGTKFLFNQILANPRGYLKYRMYGLYSVKVVGLINFELNGNSFRNFCVEY